MKTLQQLLDELHDREAKGIRPSPEVNALKEIRHKLERFSFGTPTQLEIDDLKPEYEYKIENEEVVLA